MIVYNSSVINGLRPSLIYEQKTVSFEVEDGNVELLILDWRGYAGYYWIGLLFSYATGVNICPITTNCSVSPISASGHNISVLYEEQAPSVTRYKMNIADFY